jgi:hypothetical protein
MHREEAVAAIVVGEAAAHERLARWHADWRYRSNLLEDMTARRKAIEVGREAASSGHESQCGPIYIVAGNQEQVLAFCALGRL